MRRMNQNRPEHDIPPVLAELVLDRADNELVWHDTRRVSLVMKHGPFVNVSRIWSREPRAKAALTTDSRIATVGRAAGLMERWGPCRGVAGLEAVSNSP